MNWENMKYLFIISVLVTCMAAVSYVYFDIPSATYFFSVKNKPPGKIVKIITEIGRAEWYLVPGILVFFIYRKRKRVLSLKAMFLFSSVAVSGILVNIIKVIFGRVRPTLYFSQGLSGFDFFRFDPDFLSFPSGHSATSLSAAVALGIIFPKYRFYLILMGMIVASSRMYLTNHYLSDVLMGSLLGAWTSIVLYQEYFKKRIHEVTEIDDSDNQTPESIKDGNP